MEKYFLAFGVLFLLFSCSKNIRKDYPIRPVAFTDVHLTDDFWAPRLETNRSVTVPYDFRKCEETGRIDNFAKAGGLMAGDFIGIRYNDSDVFKVIEGASYSLSLFPDPKLEKYLDDLIAKIAAAQEDDGYLYTARTINPENLPPRTGKTRWSYLNHSHELYNVGHMYEAAVAFYQATGKRTLLDVAIKNANLIDSVFGPNKLHNPPGHQEIEIGLIKLYRVTGDERYLRLAKFFLDQRGYERGRKLYTDLFTAEYTQDHKPVVEQDEAVGHAVRAGYMYSAMADVAALTGDKKYLNAIEKIWHNVVGKKLYITGGIGAKSDGEAFGENYELPNRTAYNETCAAIANMMWNHRMFLLHGDAKYIDVLERTLYNGFLSGVGLSGKEFFYPNPLESGGEHQRSPWFDCSCCPTNVVRFLPSLPGYVYAEDDDAIYVNLFIQGKAKISHGGQEIEIRQKTNYPWDGKIVFRIFPEKPREFLLKIRMPNWAQNKPVPSDLYYYLDKKTEKPILKINNQEISYVIDKGFAKIRRKWQAGDSVELDLPMKIRKVAAHEKVAADRGKISLERGPIVFCAEGVDNDGHALNIVLPKDVSLTYLFNPELLHGIGMLRGKAIALTKKTDGAIKGKEKLFTAIPYYAWAHRGKGEMTVWFPCDEKFAGL
ncbi:six-hairpin glycosidase [candidate division KSB1 bacterium 4484_87]|nr:MAG: six-hairpin glycosidase [candidate division KSB1 bacterium 4484_87]